MEHSIIPASSSYIWRFCTGWYKMSSQHPETEVNQDALDGEASHEIGFTLIEHYKKGNDKPLPFSFFKDSCATNGVYITEEMYDGALIYANDVKSIMDQSKNIMVFTEQRIDCPDIHAKSFGTPDNVIFNFDTFNLYLHDYKFGHDMVEAFENWQLLVYFSGILKKLNLDDKHIIVHFRIIQPRAFHRDGVIREWIAKAIDLRSYTNILYNKAHEALGPNPLILSGSHCKHCSARHACPAALQAGIKLYEVAKQAIPVELPYDAMGVQYAIVKRAIQQLQSLETGMKAQLESYIKSGKKIPGWTLASGQGREMWTKPPSEVALLGKIYEKDLNKETEVVTPKQARAKGIPDEVLSQYCETKRTALMLVEETGNKAKKLFSEVKIK